MGHRIKAVPVIDGRNRLVGIVSVHDFFVAAADGPPQASKAARVEEIMTHEVRVARPQQRLAGLVEAFSNGGLHHLPVLDAEDRLVGMVTQSDMVAALFLVQPGMAQAMQVAPLRRRGAASQPA